MSEQINSFDHQLEQLVKHNTHLLLKDVQHGIEKEGLRVDSAGWLSQEKHPPGLGSALMNSHITTDFSESQLELITPVFKSPEDVLQFLEDLHTFTYQHLDEELIWAGSMPCHIPSSESIPIAWYGSSNVGMMKHIYRVGLDHRYGRLMQSIAGIHYNLSLPESFWIQYKDQEENRAELQTFQSAGYFRLIRNFRRHSWLLLYLFGASPALCKTFLNGKAHDLQILHDQTLYLPYATSLRMSDLGYSTKAQASLDICFNHLKTYISSLKKAIITSYPPYTEIGVKVSGTYRQLSDAILQIENEYYSDIRPKRSIMSAERHLQALQARGVEYVEVRHTDVNPFLPAGIDAEQARMIDIFLISCLLMSGDEICTGECTMISKNMQLVINRGREPGLMLTTSGGEKLLAEMGSDLLNEMEKTAQLLDQLHQTTNYCQTIGKQREKIADPGKTPSAQVLDELKATGLNYTDWTLQKSKER